jgi:AraC-like DNA-binding protein
VDISPQPADSRVPRLLIRSRRSLALDREEVITVSYAGSHPAHGLAGRLVADVLAMTSQVGPNRTEWPGLTVYRFSRPQVSQWAEVHSLALCCVLQGRKRLVLDGDEYVCDPAHYLLFTRGMRFETEIVEASADEPFLSLVLQIEPALVSSVLVDVVDHRPPAAARSAGDREAMPALVSAFDVDLAESIRRFLRSLAGATDRRVLAPMYLREIVYRLMQVDQVSRLLRAVARERDMDPVEKVTRYIRERMAEPLTVADMARHAQLSPSALTARFVEATGVGPYQFAKRMRLEHARALLVQDELTVSEIVREVGYTSLSYFINEFKRQFATTPGAYAKAQRRSVAMRIEEATRRAA